MDRILVSACLMGLPVRYDGSSKPLVHEAMECWKAEGRLVAICPELSGGFSTPRPPAEIEASASGRAVLEGAARVVEASGADVTALYLDGARAALDLARRTGCRYALLIDGSPSCGSGFIYDGSFSSRRHAGEGVTAALLRENGIEVFSHGDIGKLVDRLAASA